MKDEIYDKCVMCGETMLPNTSGLCDVCYAKYTRKKADEYGITVEELLGVCGIR